MKQADIVRARDFRSFINAVKVLSLPPMKGNDLVVLSRSGGIAIIAADSAERYGFRLLPLKRSFQDRIQSYFRAKVIRPTNPLDLGDLFDFEFATDVTWLRLETSEEAWDLFRHGYGPTKTLAATLSPERLDVFRKDFLGYYERYRIQTGIAVPREYLLAIGTRR